MADTVHLTDVGVLGVGDFGLALSERLRRDGAAVQESDDLTGRPGPTALQALVVALWRPLDDLCERIDETCSARNLPWLPVSLDHPRLVVGPWIVPGSGPCHRCYRARRAQHRAAAEPNPAVADAFAKDQRLGVRGFLPHHVVQAAGLTHQALRLCSPGEVLTLNILTGRLACHRTLGCHGCPRCGREDRLGAGRVVERAVHALTGVPDSAERSGRDLPAHV